MRCDRRTPPLSPPEPEGGGCVRQSPQPELADASARTGAQAVPRLPGKPRAVRFKAALLSQSAPVSKTLCAGPPRLMHRVPSTGSAHGSAHGSHCSDRVATAAHSTGDCVSPLTDVPFSALVPSCAARMSLDRSTMQTSGGGTSHTSHTEIALVSNMHVAAVASSVPEVRPSMEDRSCELDGCDGSPPPPNLELPGAHAAWRRLLQTPPPATAGPGAPQAPHAMCMCGGGCSTAAQLHKLPAANDAKDSLQDAFFASLGFQPHARGAHPAAAPHSGLADARLVMHDLELPDLGALGRPRLSCASLRGTAHVTRNTTRATLAKALDSAAEFARAAAARDASGRSGTLRAAWASGGRSQNSTDSTRVCMGSAQLGRPSDSSFMGDVGDAGRVAEEVPQQHAPKVFNVALPSFAPLASAPRSAVRAPHSVLDVLAARDTAAVPETEDEGVIGMLSDEEVEDATATRVGAVAVAAMHAAVVRQSAEERSPEGSMRTGADESVSSGSDAWVSSFVPHAGRSEVSGASAEPLPRVERSSLDICLRRLRGQVEVAAEPSEAESEAAQAPAREFGAASLALLRKEAAEDVSRVTAVAGTAPRSFLENEARGVQSSAAPEERAPQGPAPHVPPLPPGPLPRLRLARPSADAVSATAPTTVSSHSAAAVRRRGTSIDVSLLRRNREMEGRLREGAASRADAPTILCVDDNAVNQLVISRMLQSAGMRVDKAMSGAEALRKLQEAGDRLPDLLIMDVMMPGINGLDLCRRALLAPLPSPAFTAFPLTQCS